MIRTLDSASRSFEFLDIGTGFLDVGEDDCAAVLEPWGRSLRRAHGDDGFVLFPGHLNCHSGTPSWLLCHHQDDITGSDTDRIVGDELLLQFRLLATTIEVHGIVKCEVWKKQIDGFYSPVLTLRIRTCVDLSFQCYLLHLKCLLKLKKKV